jgi:D-alanyl-D-alanine carboxypeptidase
MRKMTAAFLCLGLLGAGPMPIGPALQQRIAAIARSALVPQNVPGISIAVAEHGRIVYAHGFGWSDLDERIPVDSGTSFRIGSITKQFTASSIMLLQQAGKLNVDDKLSKYLPNAPHAAEVTLRQLLTHTSGIPGYTELESFDAASKLPVTPEGIVQTIAGKPLAFKPGTKWEYSNTNFILLGLVVQKVSGQPYEDFVRTHFIEPLRLSSMSYWNPLLVHHDAAVGYSTMPFEPPLHTIDWNWDWAWAAGGLNTNASDLARWDVALDSGKVVSPASFAMMTTAQKLANGKSAGYGFGLGIGEMFHRKVVAHSGGVPGFITENFTIPHDGVAIVVLGNSDGFQPGPLARQIAYAIYGAKEPAPKVHPLSETGAQAAKAKRYLDDALAGRFSDIPMRADFSRYMHGVAAAEYVGLGRHLGKLISLQLIGSDPRPPIFSYFYRAVFQHGTMLYSMGLDSNGTVSGVGFEPWL